MLLGMGLEVLPEDVACALKRLTHIAMEANSFVAFPSAVSLVTSLRVRAPQCVDCGLSL